MSIRRTTRIGVALWVGWLAATLSPVASSATADSFRGTYFAGEGDAEYLQLLDISRRMFAADPEFQNIAMLYTPQWNGLVEGPTWGAWWVQNSYGTTYCALPFYEEPFVTFLQNAQDLWFDRMGDGKTSYVWNEKDRWVPPDGCLMDAASDTWAIHRQGDGRVAIHDWGMEFTAAGALLQSELLLIGRDPAAVGRYLPKLERCANFIESRRDPTNNLFLAGPAGNLLAPSYAGFRRPDGTYGMAYLTGLSVTYVAFLDRLIELEKLAGRTQTADQLTTRRASALAGLKALTTDDGYLIKYLDPDGTRHGVYGAERHGYFEASPNHDAICFRVADDSQAGRIYRRMASIPGLRPHDLIIPNFPSLDDMYEEPKGLWAFGTWVNGGHWTTCEARMMLAYYRVGAFEDARRSMQQILRFARQFRLDNPLVEFGGAVYQPREPINITYDAFGAPAGMIRGLFEYLYRADGLVLVPHLPQGISRLEQRFPIRFGTKRLFLATSGHGPITEVRVNGRRWTSFDGTSVFLPYEATPDIAAVEIVTGEGTSRSWHAPKSLRRLPEPGPTISVQQPTTAAPVIAATELPLRLGADSDGGSRFLGEIARVALFDRSLNGAEIAALSRDEAEPLLRDLAVVGSWSPGRLTNGVVANAVARAPDARQTGRGEIVDSRFGPVLRLNGDGYLEVTNHPALTLSHGGTWYAWVRPDTTQGRLIDKCPVGGATGYTFDTYPGNALRLITDAGTVSAGARLPAGEWVHLAATVNTNGTSTLYVNGKPVAVLKGGSGTAAVNLAALDERVGRVRRFWEALAKAGLADTYEAEHARWVVDYAATIRIRAAALNAGRLPRLPDRSQAAADRLYLSTTEKLLDGLTRTLDRYRNSPEPSRARMHKLWETASGAQ